IRRAVNNLRAEGKPVVASMSSVAASGGYWVAMDADQIWAHPTTITGSIGVFGLIPTLEKTLEKIGVHTDGVGTTAMAGTFRIDRPLSPDVQVIIQAGIDKVYKDFIGGVSAGRKLPIEKVDALARGRVWSGADAREMGLVDEFGSLEDAGAAAAKLAGLDPETYQLDERLPDRGFAASVLTQFSGKLDMSVLGGLVPGAHSWLRQLQMQADVQQLLSGFNDPRGAYARCFCTVSTGRGH
ncbi:MAG: S49 family peptidase, partial [Pseudomonadota bacterium]|nr:S49 family peptidase [Pseudomonadota bacterium]